MITRSKLSLEWGQFMSLLALNVPWFVLPYRLSSLRVTACPPPSSIFVSQRGGITDAEIKGTSSAGNPGLLNFLNTIQYITTISPVGVQ